MKKVFAGFFVLIAAAILSACATDEKEVATLKSFNQANYFFTKGKYEPAQKKYQKILDEEPDSPFRIHALLGVADSYYMEKEYYLAIPMYQRFIELYPMDERTPHALFYEGMSYYLDMFKMQRDQTNTRNALKEFKKFAASYHDHPAAGFAKKKIVEIEERLAESLYLIAEFYHRIDAFGACIGRADELLEKYPGSRFASGALLLKAKSYMEEQAFEKAKTVFARISREYPGTDEGNAAASEFKKLEVM
jgi:outer membrane protein assembly factor BamD